MTTPQFPCRLRFRPESEEDANALKAQIEPALGADRLTLINPAPGGADDSEKALHQMGGRIWEFEARSTEEVSDLLGVMAMIANGQQILRTVDLAEHFTGDAYADKKARAERVTGLLGSEHRSARLGYLTYMGLEDDVPGDPA
ncbi:hypothetical protein FGK63_08510 [Ruegeria sediminis]|uniref:Uncharacterized protein n=1 Tax=Ruegeria sediminis TaxID=2583820 RepID=A0ABY2X1M5_9RHOB|nr:hypothetical protein [Ruegeria sediminis]TMV09140.1 hypothetical protein FGK63_08510 [Ruegeria sediminis]